MNHWIIAYTIIKAEGIEISTVMPRFALHGEYETEISIDGRNCGIVEGYDSEEEALKGHSKYVKMTKEEILKLSYLD